jgi:hypothetical protein
MFRFLLLLPPFLILRWQNRDIPERRITDDLESGISALGDRAADRASALGCPTVTLLSIFAGALLLKIAEFVYKAVAHPSTISPK